MLARKHIKSSGNRYFSRLFLLLLLVMLGAIPGKTFAEGLEFSGFFDFQYLHSSESGSNTAGFQYGQFEIGVFASLSDRVSAEGALALNPDDMTFEPGAGFVEIDFSKRSQEANYLIEQAGLMIGQFDVPFGIDYKVIPSPDRALVNAPLVNSRTIDSWNSIGLALTLENSAWNFTGFVVNGMVESSAAGGRLGLQFFPDFEIGVSATKELGNNLENSPQLFGGDFQYTLGQTSWKGEYIRCRGILEGSATEQWDDTHSGYYIQGRYDLPQFRPLPLFLVGRYGAWNPDDGAFTGQDEVSSEQQIVAGFGVRFAEFAEFRTELIRVLDESVLLTFQLVAGF